MTNQFASNILATATAAAFLAIAPVSSAVSADNASDAKQGEAQSTHVRGTIESLDGSILTVKSRDGSDVEVMLDDGWGVGGIKKASAEDIDEGDFVGIASLPGSEGGSDAVEVLIFPASMKGTGEGSYAWDLKPNSTMTNATVANAVEKVDGQTVTLTYNDGETKDITIPKDTPIVTFAPATKDDLKEGASVFIPAKKAADGTISSSQVVVGNNGVVPPM